uniref:YEATS domain-containing protein n=1 Tax=Parascaris univalens TaxID=6257 RepID=A0A915A1G3_PARUN
MGFSRAVVRLRVGHSAEVLNFRTIEGYTHKWTVFVRSAGPHQFVDCSFIRKVVFILHPDFNNCHRVIKQPPFEVTEYGFAGFCIPIYVYFSGFNKSLRILYNMELCLADVQWRNCMMKVVEAVKGQGKAHERVDESMLESKKQLEEIFEFKQDRSSPVGMPATLDEFAIMGEINCSLMETGNVENKEVGKASVTNSEFVSEVDESRIEIQNEFDIVMQQCDSIEPYRIVEERMLNEKHSSMGDLIDEEETNKSSPKVVGVSACKMMMETGEVSETSVRESESSLREGEAMRSQVIALAEVKEKSLAELGCRKRGLETRLATVKEISVDSGNEIEMEQNSAEMLMIKARERTKQRLMEERWGENELVGNKQQPSMVGNTEKKAVVKMCARRQKRLFDDFDGEEERLPADKFVRSSGAISSVDEGTGGMQGAVTLFTDETASDWKERKKSNEDLQNALTIRTRNEHFRKDELYLEPVVHDNARENLESGVSSLTPNNSVCCFVFSFFHGE